MECTKFQKAYINLAKKIGVKFNFNSEITKLKINNKKISYLEINKTKKIEADYVISNVDTHHFYNKLLGKRLVIHL